MAGARAQKTAGDYIDYTSVNQVWLGPAPICFSGFLVAVPKYSALCFFALIIRLAVITVTVIPAVVLIIIHAMRAVTVSSENTCFVDGPARANFVKKLVLIICKSVTVLNTYII